jgi:uncharacterized protein
MTSVHPESYEAAMKLLSKLNMSMEDVKENWKKTAQAAKETAKAPAPKPQKQREKKLVIKNTGTAMGAALAAALGNSFVAPAEEEKPAKQAPKTASTSLLSKVHDIKKTAEELGIGEITLEDILKELDKPARDPRSDMPAPILRSDVLDMKDLKPGLILKGTVRNVIDFGVFVDIGVHQDGLVHISRITDRYIKHPLEAVSVGDVVDVKVLDVDLQKKRISLTMRLDEKTPAGK